MFIYRQTIGFILQVFLDISQGYYKLVILGTLGLADYAHSKWYYLFVGNFRIYLFTKNSQRFWGYCKDLQTSYFGYFGHTWLSTSKMIVATCKKLPCLSACQKNFIIFFFLEILHFKESCNLIYQQYFGP